MSVNHILASLGLVLALTACQGGRDPLNGSDLPLRTDDSSVAAAEARQWQPYSRAEDYSDITIERHFVTMRDGNRIAVRVARPVDDSGEAVATALPVIMTVTAYNGDLSGFILHANHLVKRGYVHIYVDDRGTGSSEGTWDSFGEAAQNDYLDILNWLDEQPFSDGNVGTWGPSYMGITQFFIAQHQHPSHKAIFAIVPVADAYRDIFLTGGQINVGFVPLWGGLIAGLGALPITALIEQPDIALTALLDHITGSLLTFTVPTLLDSLLGSATAYDGPFWRLRSPIEVIDRVQTPTFLIGGLNDLFQRGTPLLYDALKDQVDTKLLIGPWTHLGGSFGTGLPADGVPNLEDIALQWFDFHLRGDDNGALQQPDVTQYVYGAEKYVTTTDWPHPQARAKKLYLNSDGSLDSEQRESGTQWVLQQPINGLCSMSASQWTAGVLGMLPLPCDSDNRLTELLEVSYTTPVLDEPLYVNGPIQANVWMSTTALDAGLVVRVTDVYPDGRSQEITNGLLTASMRAVDPEQSRYLDGEMIQPWHPFTAEVKEQPGIGNIVELNVEIFPSSFVIQPGHALRVSVGASDLPHGLPPIPDLLSGLLGVLTLHSGPEHPSNIVLPVVENLPPELQTTE